MTILYFPQHSIIGHHPTQLGQFGILGITKEQPFKELRLKSRRISDEEQGEKQDIAGHFIDSLNPTKPINKRFKSNIGLLGLLNRRQSFTRKEDHRE